MAEQKKLNTAAEHGSLEEIERLHRLGSVDIDAVTEEKYNEDFLAAGSSALWIACWFGKVQAVEILAKLGANTRKCDEEGRSPLYAAATQGNDDVLRWLVESG